MRRPWVIALAAAVGTLTLFAGVGAADAHVTVAAVGAVEGGSDSVITFRVPTESDTASTTGLKLRLPIDTPLLGVLVQPMSGWTDQVVQATLARPVSTDDGPVTRVVSGIDWTATGGGIKPGGFQQFTIIAGQLPRTATLTFKAIQHYSDGTNVSWVEVAGPGAAEPDHPAPTLNLSPASVTASTPVGSPSAARSGSAAMGTPAATAKGASNTAVVLAIALATAGIVLAAAALLLAVSMRRQAY